jgi:hypothetical protein
LVLARLAVPRESLNLIAPWWAANPISAVAGGKVLRRGVGWRVRQARTDHWDSPDRTEPMLANEPMESSEAKEPAEAIDRMDPEDPMDRIDPDEPMDKMDPVEPMLRMEPAEPD